jgi:hypothetical protein
MSMHSVDSLLAALVRKRRVARNHVLIREEAEVEDATVSIDGRGAFAGSARIRVDGEDRLRVLGVYDMWLQGWVDSDDLPVMTKPKKPRKK